VTPADLQAGFAATLDADPARLHVAAHSHHPWPDVVRDAQLAAWRDATVLLDRKWDHVFADVLPEVQRWIAHRLALPDPATIAVAPNTHELVTRILSCLDPPVRVLTTAGEFTSFERQIRRLAEDGLVVVERVPVEPFPTLDARLAERAAAGGYDLLFTSHVLYNSGVIVDVDAVVAAVPDERPFVIVDGYHGFMAVPTDLSRIADRAFYTAGGYKYAMAGEGVCFAHCPPGYGRRPRDTGWFADFAALPDGPGADVGYGPGGQRFMGATFDPTPLHRFLAVQRWLDDAGVDVAAIHAHVRSLQRRLLASLPGRAGVLGTATPVAAPGPPGSHGHLLAFPVADAARATATLADRRVVVDHRAGRVRVGLGVYHDAGDVDRLLDRL
jgi:kynureninase